MKCTRCHGTGKITEWVATDTVSEYKFPCRKCNGTGEIEVTNEEYIRSCSSEELAKLIYKIAVTDVLLDRFFTAEMVNAGTVDEQSGVKEAEKWLKETHKE